MAFNISTRLPLGLADEVNEVLSGCSGVIDKNWMQLNYPTFSPRWERDGSECFRLIYGKNPEHEVLHESIQSLKNWSDKKLLDAITPAYRKFSISAADADILEKGLHHNTAVECELRPRLEELIRLRVKVIVNDHPLGSDAILTCKNGVFRVIPSA